MCKVMTMVGLAKDKRELAWRFAEVAVKEMSWQDRDGFGYAAIDGVGTIFAEKWINNGDAFKVRDLRSEKDLSILDKLKDVFYQAGGKVPYASFGEALPAEACAILLHSRMATCPVTIENTHPFIFEDGKTALIHNGVISNTKELENITSTCDSECILNSYVLNGADLEPEYIQQVAEDLEGSYACGVLGSVKGVPYLDMFRNQRNPLYMAKIKELNCMVFCTTSTIIENVAKALGMTIEYGYHMKENWLIRFNAVTGDVMATVPFKTETKATGSHGGGSGGGPNVTHFPSRGGASHSGQTANALADAYRASQSEDLVSDEDITEEHIKKYLEEYPRAH